MSQENNVVAVFDQFAVQLADGPALFDTEAEATLALAAFTNGATNLKTAQDYTASLGLEVTGKNAKAKINVITAFLTWVDAGMPEYVAPEADGDEEDVKTETSTDATF